ncbi:Vascular endothelial growth factor receptor kdr-like protein [Gossypium arboreum]|uniref:Vascular endothelial growth factor receptor kdr-like protein n=2 Tax=Gossypium arboreum TaxID=29729 RepID=A0A0B0NJG1_GOSAR|nr:uncharacterized protein LOC108485909 isoform X2 [Gossypium arboreum]KAK5844994.1 hypothetical protein PVK06_001145 [Gossypium arboreum]KHG11939.1 Vascular endothelial growth factor receptor kdr-like protein [Gossypium arboreum]
MLSLNVRLMGRKRKIAKRSRKRRLARLKAEMEGIKKEQKSINEGQRQVRKRMEAIGEECQQLSIETNKVIRQTAVTQIRLAIMFNILKARQDGDIAKASHLTHLLRETMGRA